MSLSYSKTTIIKNKKLNIMKKNILTILLAIISLTLSAQNTKNLQVINNSKSLIQQAVKLVDQGKIDQAIEIYNKIPYGDPNYDYAQYEKAYAYEIQEKYTQALNILTELEKNPSLSVPRVNVYTELGNCYDYLEQYDKAVAMYDKGLENHPYYYHLHFNKGVSLMRQEKYEEALECFKTSIFLHPSHQGSHFQYGHCCLLLGYTMPGILALNYSTLISASSNYAILALRELDNIYEGGIASYNTDNKVYVEQEYKEKNKFYEEASTALNLAIISPKSVKCPSKIDNDIVKRNYVVLSHINVRPNSNEIEDQLYAPFFNKIIAEKEYNAFSYYLFSGTDLQDGKVAQKAEKMSKSIQPIINDLVEQLNEVSMKGLGKAPSDTIYFYDHFNILSWGVGTILSKDKVDRHGTWYFVNEIGQLSSIETYDGQELHGPYQNFQDNLLVEEYEFSHGVATGTLHAYNYQPLSHERILIGEMSLRDSKPNGAFKQYNGAGIISMEGTAQNGVPQGEYRKYYENGEIMSIEHTSDGEQVGPQQYYYANGQLSSEYTAGAPGEATPYTAYYPNGKVKTAGLVKDNHSMGDFKQFYPNGALKETYSYNNEGNLDGEDIDYFRNGNIERKYSYKNGKADGECTEYGFGGRPIFKFNVTNGNLTSVTTYRPDGSIREEYPVKNKTVTYDVYDENDLLLATETRDSKGVLTGNHKLYFANGNLREECTFKDGKRNGVFKSYDPNGSLTQYAEYKNGMHNGLCITYLPDEAHTISQEAFYRNDTITGASYTYYYDGSLYEKSLYDEDGDFLYYGYYLPDGKMIREIYYYQGMPLLTYNYDLEGNLLHCDTTSFGNGFNNNYYLNGQVRRSREMKAGKRIQHILYDLNGTPYDTVNYINGQINDIDYTFFPTGEVKSSVNNILGNKDGKMVMYSPLGQVTKELDYELDALQGSIVNYYPNGKMSSKANVIQDAYEGAYVFYDPTGKTVLLEIDYNNENAFQYSYLQANGHMSQPQRFSKEAQTVTAQYPNGKTALVANFEQGLRNGSWVVYYTNGQAAESAQYKNGDLDGSYLFYYPNGKICQKADYRNGVINGAYELYFENGQKAYEGNYLYDAHGDFKKYDQTGKLLHKVTTYYGIPTKEEK